MSTSGDASVNSVQAPAQGASTNTSKGEDKDGGWGGPREGAGRPMGALSGPRNPKALPKKLQAELNREKAKQERERALLELELERQQTEELRRKVMGSKPVTEAQRPDDGKPAEKQPTVADPPAKVEPPREVKREQQQPTEVRHDRKAPQQDRKVREVAKVAPKRSRYVDHEASETDESESESESESEVSVSESESTQSDDSDLRRKQRKHFPGKRPMMPQPKRARPSGIQMPRHLMHRDRTPRVDFFGGGYPYGLGF